MTKGYQYWYVMDLAGQSTYRLDYHLFTPQSTMRLPWALASNGQAQVAAYWLSYASLLGQRSNPMVKPPLAHRARKRFGQNFLQDGQIIDQIVQAIRPRPGEALVEIGPGLGALTEPVARLSNRLTVIELDRELAANLAQHSPVAELLICHQQDALAVDFSILAAQAGQPLRIFGNLPYNVATPLLFVLFNHAEHIRDMVFMLQAEVVDRLVASPNNKLYGRLSVMAQYFCQIERVLSVPARAFYPEPKVTSAVVRLIPHTEKSYAAKVPHFLKQVCAAAFNQRRKTIRNSLRTLFTPQQLTALGINPALRAENLTLEHFCQLANSLADCSAESTHNH